MDAAWEEFSRVPYTEVSINKIVLRARIPRGSFYQYFSDKKELFFYLLDDMIKLCYTEYNKILVKMKGDIFQTQMRCFERISPGENLNHLLGKGRQIIEKNPGFLMQVAAERQISGVFWESVRGNIDLAAFKSEEAAKHAFELSTMALVVSARDMLGRPEQIEASRRELEMRLNILKFGSLAKQPV